MSLPNYLAKIKSSGVYRFVWDKSVLPAQTAETMRLLVGYSEKGPFNTPVYIESESDFVNIYGNISKRLERKGIYFHRLATQALAAGPILALNVKPFTDEAVEYMTFDSINLSDKKKETKVEVDEETGEETTVETGNIIPNLPTATSIAVKDVYDTNRFWVLNADLLPSKVENSKYITVTQTDVKENSCTIFMRPTKPESYKGITIRQWYNSQSLELPEYLTPIQDTYLDEYFMDAYVFRGQFTDELCKNGGVLATYFDQEAAQLTIKTKDYTDAFGDTADALYDMSTDVYFNFVSAYTGIKGW